MSTKEFTFTGKQYTPKLNDFVQTLIADGPDLDAQTLMTVLAIMDETLQDIMQYENTDDSIIECILSMYEIIENYFEMDNEGH